MKLNMTIIGDYLENINIQYRQTNNLYTFSLINPCLWTNETTLSSNYVYLAYADSLPPLTDTNQMLSLICIGDIPAIYQGGHHEIICVDSSVSITNLMNQVLEVFNKFNAWDTKLMNACLDNYSLHNIGEIGYEIFNNCLSCWDPQERMLFLVYLSDTNLPELYPAYENSYLSEDFRQILSIDKTYQEALKAKKPSLFPEGLYPTKTLYYNLFDNEVNIARIGIEPYNRPFIPSDYSLIMHFGNYVLKSLLQINTLHIAGTEQFDIMIQNLILNTHPYDAEYKQLLRSYGWDTKHIYQCAYILLPTDRTSSATLYGSITYLYHQFNSIYILKNEEILVLIFNISKCNDKDNYMNKLESYLKAEQAHAGISNLFEDFSELYLYAQQAYFALKTCRKNGFNKTLYAFDTIVLDLLLTNSQKDLPVQMYYTRQLQKLMDYDKNKNTELCKTLHTYLQDNSNAAQAIRDLHIHKTTFLYRMNRIQEISGFNLKDYKTKLYLMIMFEIL